MNAAVVEGGFGGLWGSGGFQTHATSLLRMIVHGSSSTSMNLIRLRQSYEKGHRLFRNALFYRSIIFKYPVDATIGLGGGATVEGAGGGIGTGVYLPMDIDDPLGGGQAMFLDRPQHRRAFMDQLEANRRGTLDTAFDVRVLNVIASAPTVDPFLVKLLLANNRIQVSAEALPLQAEEENATGAAIARRLGPVYRRAALVARQADGSLPDVAATADAKARILARLIAACGHPPVRPADLAVSLDGLSYYEFLYGQTQERLRAVGAWLNGPAAEPADLATLTRSDQVAFRNRRMLVTNRLVRTLRNVNQQFGTFNRAVEDFVHDGPPEAFAAFVATNKPRFVGVGFELSSVVNVCSAVERRWVGEKGPVRTADVAATLDLLSQIIGAGPPQGGEPPP